MYRHPSRGNNVTSNCGIARRLRGAPLCRGDAVSIPAKILIADDQQRVRSTLRSLLTTKTSWKIYEAADGKQAIDETKRIHPDVAVLDIVMPVMSGIEAAYEMRRLVPETKIILMSSHYTPEEAAALARLFGDGNFVSKSEAGTDLVPAINRVLPAESRAG
jgi:DNA-binding NarL/FixJ family response regulator